MGNTGLLRHEAEMTLLQPQLGETRCQELRNSPCWHSSLFKSQLVKERQDFLIKKGTSKDSQGFGPYQTSPNGPLEGTQTLPIPGRLAAQVPVSGGSPSEHSGSGIPNPVLEVDNKSGKIRTKANSGVFVRGLRIPSRFSPCKTHSREMAQTSGFDPVEDHDMVLSLPDNIESQTHSRVSECDGRPSIQVEPSSVNRMVTTHAGVQSDLAKVVHSSCRSICHSSEPQTSTVRVSSPRPKCLGHRCSEHKLDGSHCLCLPSDGSPSQGDPKNQAMPLPDHRNSPRLARDALVLRPGAALNRDPTSASSVNKSSQTVPQVCVPH